MAACTSAHYLVSTKIFDVHEIWKDIYTRPLSQWVLAFTCSFLGQQKKVNDGWIRRLGGAWRILHSQF